MRLSIIVPVYNEAENITLLYKEILEVLSSAPYAYEIIVVNDGSKDNSQDVIDELAKNDKKLRVIVFNKNYGQTAALAAGIDAASGEIVIPMDADLQNDPHDIPKLLEVIDTTGVDAVSGWRKHRQDTFMRRLPSRIANRLISAITSVQLHDYGCTMKAYRRESIKNIRLYGEMHRLIPAYLAWHGAQITECVVNHRARKFGKSKYGISRTFRVILDLLTIKFLMTYLTRPIHFFGGTGLALIVVSGILGIFACYLRLAFDIHFIRTPLPLLTVFFLLMGIQCVLMGILAEILIRIHHEPKGRSTYSVRRTLNFETGEEKK